MIHVRSGSLLWEPGRGVQAPPIDLTTATAVPPDADSKAENMGTAILATSAGQIQLDHDTAMVALLQRVAAEQGQSPIPARLGRGRPRASMRMIYAANAAAGASVER